MFLLFPDTTKYSTTRVISTTTKGITGAIFTNNNRHFTYPVSISFVFFSARQHHHFQILRYLLNFQFLRDFYSLSHKNF
eukprot:UN00219